MSGAWYLSRTCKINKIFNYHVYQIIINNTSGQVLVLPLQHVHLQSESLDFILYLTHGMHNFLDPISGSVVPTAPDAEAEVEKRTLVSKSAPSVYGEILTELWMSLPALGCSGKGSYQMWQSWGTFHNSLFYVLKNPKIRLNPDPNFNKTWLNLIIFWTGFTKTGPNPDFGE